MRAMPKEWPTQADVDAAMFVAAARAARRVELCANCGCADVAHNPLDGACDAEDDQGRGCVVGCTSFVPEVA